MSHISSDQGRHIISCCECLLSDERRLLQINYLSVCENVKIVVSQSIIHFKMLIYTRAVKISKSMGRLNKVYICKVYICHTVFASCNLIMYTG